jgi:hypothetical protein
MSEPGGRPDWVRSTEEAATPPWRVEKIGYQIPVSCCMARSYGMDVECNHELPPLTRRTRLRWWLRERWDRRPRVHFGPCDHEDCC